jgi:hypothetical protein
MITILQKADGPRDKVSLASWHFDSFPRDRSALNTIGQKGVGVEWRPLEKERCSGSLTSYFLSLVIKYARDRITIIDHNQSEIPMTSDKISKREVSLLQTGETKT